MSTTRIAGVALILLPFVVAFLAHARAEGISEAFYVWRVAASVVFLLGVFLFLVSYGFYLALGGQV